MHKPRRRWLAGLTLATTATLGALTATDTLSIDHADTAWSAPATDTTVTTDDTAWGTPPTGTRDVPDPATAVDDVSTTIISPFDTAWG
jgi:hypothetical protein